MNNKVQNKTESHDTGQMPVMSEFDLARLGGGEVAYIKTLSPGEASKMFPSIEGLPRGIPLFSLHAADGTPIALTDSMQAAIGHAEEGELVIAPLN